MFAERPCLYVLPRRKGSRHFTDATEDLALACGPGLGRKSVASRAAGWADVCGHRSGLGLVFQTPAGWPQLTASPPHPPGVLPTVRSGTVGGHVGVGIRTSLRRVLPALGPPWHRVQAVGKSLQVQGRARPHHLQMNVLTWGQRAGPTRGGTACWGHTLLPVSKTN